MKAMILAAGRGKRMGMLTADTPKPMLKVHGKPLIEYTIEKLIAAGLCDLVINLNYLGEQIKTHLGDGSKYGVTIAYSERANTIDWRRVAACYKHLSCWATKILC